MDPRLCTTSMWLRVHEMIFNTKWKKRYESHRKEIEDKGWDVFIGEPFDLYDYEIV